MAPRRILLVHGKAEACFRFGLSDASMRFGIGRTAKVKSCFCFRFNANGPGGAPFRPAQKLRCSPSESTNPPGSICPKPPKIGPPCRQNEFQSTKKEAALSSGFVKHTKCFLRPCGDGRSPEQRLRDQLTRRSWAQGREQIGDSCSEFQ